MIKRKVFVITGANGHLGSTIVRLLSKDDVELRALVLENDNCEVIEKLGCKIYRGNICNKEDVVKLFEGVEDKQIVFIHCAGLISISSKVSDLVYNVNVLGTRNVVDCCVENKDKVLKFVYISSVHAIKENKDVIKETNDFSDEYVVGEYAKTKALATKYVLESNKRGLDYIVIHPSGIIGPFDMGHGNMTELISDYLNNKLTACVVGGYDFVDVRDVAKGIINSINSDKVNECYILSNKYYKVIEILNIVSEQAKHRRIKTILPMWFAKFTAPLSELYYKIRKKSPLYSAYSLYTLSSNSHFSHEKADKEIGYKTRDMNETIKDTVEWLRINNRVK